MATLFAPAWRPARLACAVSFALAGAGRTNAQAPVDATAVVDAPPTDEALREARYQERIAEALAEFEAGRFAEARALFRAAHAESPNARSLRGIGVASYELHDYVAAYASLVASLASQVRPLTDTQRIEAESLIARASAFVAVYDLSEVPADATLTIDGVAPSPLSDGRVLMALGSHRVIVRRGDHVAESVVTVEGGESGPLPIDRGTLDAPARGPTVVVVREVSGARAVPPVVSRTLTIAGAALGAGGAVLGLVAWRRRVDIEDSSRGTAWTGLRHDYRSGPRIGRAGAAVGALGVGSLVAGIAFLGRRRPPVDVSIDARTGLSASVRGTF